MSCTLWLWRYEHIKKDAASDVPTDQAQVNHWKIKSFLQKSKAT